MKKVNEERFLTLKIMAQHEDEIYKQIQEKEHIPDETKVLAASLDGANVLIREKGIKMGKKCSDPRKRKRIQRKRIIAIRMQWLVRYHSMS